MKVVVRDLHRRFGRTKALDGLSFELEAGKIHGFVGPNGAGKTTTMRIMATLDEPDRGDVLIDGLSVVNRPQEIRHKVGYMPDGLPNHRDITVREYLDFFARAYGLRSITRKNTLDQVMDFTGLDSFSDRQIHGLSKGMKQRVSLARALIHDPELLIMDEPAAGLDPKARIELRELLTALAETGKTIFISSHILGELTDICFGAVIIEQGRLLQAGAIDGILDQEEQGRSIWIRPKDRIDECLQAILEFPWVSHAERLNREIRVFLPASDERSSELLRWLILADFNILEFRQHKADLEEVFMKVTKGRLQ